MLQQIWAGANRKITVCVDAYENDVLRGRFYNAYQEMERFESLMQFLTRVESAMEEQRIPQAYTALRSFSGMTPDGEAAVLAPRVRKGTKATFELQVLFRQHSSWQGLIVWRERKLEQPFRSVLELVLLMDSALREEKAVVA